MQTDMNERLWNRPWQKKAKPKKIFFVGIGGISLFGLSLLSQNEGQEVQGSDMHENERTAYLKTVNIPFHLQPAPQALQAFEPDLVVYSSAVPKNHPELQMAESLNIPIWDRGYFLGYISQQYKQVLNIAGTHGKSTTTAMTGEIFLASEQKASVHVGASIQKFKNLPVHIEKDRNILVNEACEYAKNFFHLRSTSSVILNIDFDHIDYFKTVENLVEAFAQFALHTAEGGNFLFPLEDKYEEAFYQQLHALEANFEKRIHVHRFHVLSENLNKNQKLADKLQSACKWGKLNFIAHDILVEHGHFSFLFRAYNQDLGRVKLNVFGHHNISNALAALALSYLNGINFEIAKTSLETFYSAEGRFTYKGIFQGAKVYVDYAHHPASTLATIRAAKLLNAPHLWIVYQPLTYDRVARLFDQYIEALKDNELVLFYEIYSDRENDTQGMSSKLLADALTHQGYNSEFCQTKEDIFSILKEKVGNDDILLFLGPEQIRNFASDLVKLDK